MAMQMNAKPQHRLVVLFRPDRVSVFNELLFNICLAKKNADIPALQDKQTKVAASIAIPQMHHSLSNTLEKSGKNTMFIGNIMYLENTGAANRTATCESFFPQENAHSPGASFFIELLTLPALAENGIEYINSSQDPNPARKRMLKTTGIPIGVGVPIEKWAAGLLRAITKVAEEFYFNFPKAK